MLLLDADLGGSAIEGKKLLRPLIQEGRRKCLVVAKFPRRPGRRRWGLVRLFAALSILALGGVLVREPLSGQRAARREDFLRLLPFAEGYGVETAMTIDAARAGLKVVEVEAEMLHLPPASKGGKALRHKLRQLRDIALAVALRLLGLRGAALRG